MTHVLFICSRNRLRSPTAEEVFRTWPGITVASAGLKRDADEVLTREHLATADVIFVMEAVHKRELTRRFGEELRGKSLICLGVSDDYGYMDPVLISLLQRRVTPHLR